MKWVPVGDATPPIIRLYSGPGYGRAAIDHGLNMEIEVTGAWEVEAGGYIFVCGHTLHPKH